MTKKHFEAIAKIINNCRRIKPDYELINTDEIVEQMANYMETQNENFNRDKFYQACYTSK